MCWRFTIGNSGVVIAVVVNVAWAWLVQMACLVQGQKISCLFPLPLHPDAVVAIMMNAILAILVAILYMGWEVGTQRAWSVWEIGWGLVDGDTD